jgi:uncharacterized protein YfaS (alpha-2-macroglobulin family)
MRRLIGILFIFGTLILLPALSAQEQQVVGTLQVVDTAPFMGEELGLESEITVYFDRELDCETAPDAVSLTPAVQGNLVCGDGDTSLSFVPSEAYARGTEYTLQVGESLRAKDGTQLTEAFKLRLNTVGFLAVSEVFPSNGTIDIETDAVITVIFNRPVVPLVAVEDMDSLPDPLTITPAAEGKGEWLNTSIYLFRPDPALAGGTEYTVTVGTGLEAVDGSVLAEPFSWSFRTVMPEIISITPEPQSDDVELAPKIQVTFNQPMDRESAEANFYLTEVENALSGTFSWADDSTGFSFTPDALLKLNTLYKAGFNPGTVYEYTHTGTLVGTMDWSFVTVPYPAIVGTDPNDGATDVSPYGGFRVYFASPMDDKTFTGKFTIDPKPWREPDLYYRSYNDTLSVSFPTEPSTTYTITIEPGMADPYGNTIDTAFTFSYSTGPYSPDLMLQVPGSVGFYNAYNDATQLFVTHRNVSRLDLNLYEVPLIDFVMRAADEDYYYDPTYNFYPRSDTLLRQWQVPTNAPENVLRYDLLTISGDSAVSCPGAPPTRLKVGDMAIVTSDPDPVRARSAPPDGEIVDLLYRDYSLPIVGGPVCDNGILWWEVELRDETRAWVAEGIGDEYFIDLRIAAAATPVEVTSGMGEGALKPGIYFLTASSPETEREGYGLYKHFLVVSTANLVAKASIDTVTVWATDVQSGEPIPNAPVFVYDKEYRILATGTTDADGVAKMDVPAVDDLYVPRAVVLRTDDHFGLGMTSWTQGIDPWQFGQNYDFYPQRYRVYLYTDRPIYRPDQPVYFRGVIRLRDDVTYTPADMDTVPVKIYDDRGEIIYDKELPLTPFGTFSDQIDLAEDAPLGYYNISVELPTTRRYQSEGGSVGFSVAEFRVPEFQVEATPETDAVVQGDTVRVAIDSTYFFGGPVSNATVDYNVVSNAYFFRYSGKGYYDFTDYNYDSGPGEQYGSSRGLIASGTETTDERGMLMIEVPADLEDATQSQTFTVEATVRDESQQTVSGRAEVIVHQGLLYLGVRPEHYVTTAGNETNVEIIAVDWDSEGIAKQKVDVEVIERHWSSVQEEDEAGRTIWTWEVEEIPITSGKVTTDNDGKATFTYTPPTGGVFKVIVTTRDKAGNAVRSSTYMWVSSREYVSWRQQNSNRIDLIAGQTDYSVGEEAEILIASPFQGTTEALITVERGDVLKVERVTMDTNSYVYKLPIEPEYAPNVYVSVLLIKGVDETNPVAAFRMGMIQLSVDTSQKVINIDIEPDKERTGPRETVMYTIHTTDYKGDPVQAEVGVGLTDLASLSIVGPNSGPLLSYFYGEQGLGIRTGTPLTINTDQLTQETLDTIKGGGGGGFDMGIFDIRGNFVDTAYWNGSLVTDANGTAFFEVTLPDNLTTWRLDARAVTSGSDGLTLVGQDTFDLLSTKPVLIRPVTPRFFVVGDEIVLATVVNNNSGEALSVDVTLQATGVTLEDDMTQTFVIKDGERQRVTWKATVEDVENVELIYFANANDGKFTDASRPPLGQGENQLLPVYKYEAPETVGTAGVVREGGSRTEAIVLPKRFDVTQGELTIKVDQSLAATTLDGLKYLRNFPYQCTEQTISRFLPNIMTFRALDSLGLADDNLRNDLNEGVMFAVQRLYAGQKVDGGWGWFRSDNSNPVITAYALIGLAEARDAGFPVDANVIANAQGYLRTTFIVPDLSQPTWKLNRQVFSLYALARSGSPDVARSVTMFDNRERLSTYSKAFLAITLNIIDPNETSRTDVLMSDMLNTAIVSATGTHWDESYYDYWNWNTDTRTTAIVLDALIKLRPNSDLIPNVVRYLMVQRTADHWETTQETAWALMSLTDWMVASGELYPNYDYSVSFNGDLLTEGTATSATVRDTETLVVQVADMLKDEANMLVLGRTSGDGVLYYTAHLEAFLPVPEIEPLNRGVIVERRYTILGDPNEKPVTEAKIGDVVQVRLTVIVPNSLHYVVIEDPIPAGAEAINPGLEISQQIGTRPGLDRKDPLSHGWGWWYFSNIEFRDEKVLLYSTYLPAGTYEYVYTIRPGLEGTYNVIPATAQEFYFPEVYGRSAGMAFTILPSE